jgi:hypothetical protein
MEKSRRQLDFHYTSEKHKEQESKVATEENVVKHKSVKEFHDKMELHRDLTKQNYIEGFVLADESEVKPVQKEEIQV